MIRLFLNTQKRDCYAYYDEISRLHVTLTNPGATVYSINDNLARAIKCGTILDLDGVTGIEVSQETLRDKSLVMRRYGIQAIPKEVKKTVEIVDVKETEEVITEEAVVEETVAEEVVVKKGKGSRKSKAVETVEEVK